MKLNSEKNSSRKVDELGSDRFWTHKDGLANDQIGKKY